MFFAYFFLVNYLFSGNERLLGEIAYQLDRRILSYVFQAHPRLYGFILLNIPQRIIEVTPVSVRNPQPTGEFLMIKFSYE